MSQVVVPDPGALNLLGLMLADLLRRRLATPEGERQAAGLRGRYGITGGRMQVTLEFDGQGEVTLRPGAVGPLQARVSGTMAALLDVTLGRGVVRPVLTGQVQVGGKFWKLLPLLPLLRVPPEEGL